MDQVGRYRILEELGRSGGGMRYRAADPAIDKTVDLQSIPLTGGDTGEARAFRESLIGEAHSATALSHPNIVTIYDIFESGELAYISSESVDGVSLEQLLRTGTPPERRKFITFLRQIAEALDYAHRKGIMHRDLKPANIVIAGAEQAAKIAGFGMAAFVSNKVLQNGSLAGMPNYMAPEQIQGLPVTGKADQFSFGVIVYQMLCGAKPFTAENLQGLLYSICKQNPKPVQQVNPLLNETVNRVATRALAKEPEERFSSCCDFASALSFALDECPDWKPVASVAIATPPPVKAVEPPDGRDERSRAAAAALVMGTGGELPGRERTARRIAAAQPSEENSHGKRVALVIALCFVMAAAVIFIVRRNSAPPPPLQVLDTKAGPATPPPEDVKTAAKEPSPTSTEDAGAADQTLQPPPPTPSAAPTVAPSPNAAVPKAEASLESAELSRASPKPSPETKAEAQAAAAPAKTDVELVTDPPGGKVVVDSRQSCLSPCSMSLSNGRHTLTAELTGYTVAQKIIQVPEDINVFLPLVRSVGVLLVSSEPSGSKVAVDGKNYGPTPVTLHLTAGAHHLTISDGDRRHDETIEIDGDGVHTRTFRW
ncbi:MAG TPA: serine/threonine-protein kinase [Bryobacteraceae bacterium]